jgi:cytochrome c oxidase subunit IV
MKFSMYLFGSILYPNGYGTKLQVERLQVQGQMRWRLLSIYLILSAALAPGVYSPPNRNESQKQK